LEVWAECVGRPSGAFEPAQYLEELLGGPIDKALIEEERRRRFHEAVEALTPRAGVLELMQEVKSRGLFLGMASSSDRNWVRRLLKQHDLFEAFDAIRTCEDVLDAKPAPDLYQAVLEAFKVKPHEGVAIEDSPHGVAAAKAAGLYTVAVPNSITVNYDLSHADVVYDSLDELSIDPLLTRFDS